MDKIKIRDKKYAELRRLNARNYYWKKRGKGDYYFIKHDIDLLNRKLKGMQKIVNRLGLQIEIKEAQKSTTPKKAGHNSR